MVKRDESRRGRRVAITLPVLVVCGNEQFSTQTENVSLLGTYVRVAKEVPVGTPATTTLDLPAEGVGRGERVQCQGVIVRCENLSPGLFGLGVFFNQFLGEGEAKLGTLIDALLEKQTEEAERYFKERERLRKERMKKKLEEKRKKRRKRGRPPKKHRSKSSRKSP